MGNVLISGASGFLGKYLVDEFRGSEVYTIGRSKELDYVIDLSESHNVKYKFEFDLVIHAAGKAHMIPKTQEEEEEFYRVNHLGTLNLLKSLEIKPKYFVFISTVAVYGLNFGVNINEEHYLGATEPYGKSKILAEEDVLKWGRENNVVVTILRLPLLFGYEAPGNLRTMINGVRKGYYFNIGKGDTRKSMVLAKDVAEFIPKIKKIGGVYNLTDGHHPSFKEIGDIIANFYKKRTPIAINYYLVAVMASICESLQLLLKVKMPISKLKLSKMTKSLTFDDSKARARGWAPNLIIESKDKWLS